jgi:streptogrisin D
VRVSTALLGGIAAAALCVPAAHAGTAGPAAERARAGASADTYAALWQPQLQQAGTALAATLSDELGTRAAGSYLEPTTNTPVVNVLDEAAAQQVRARGATARVVPYSTDTLQEAESAFDRVGGAPNTAWGIDPTTNQVLLTISDTTPGDVSARLLGAAKQYGNRVRVQRTSGPMVEQLRSGDEITTGTIRCSVGFSVQRGGQSHILTAGHCTRGLPQWVGVGPSVDSHFPGTDYGLIRDDSSGSQAGVDLYNGSVQRITTAGNATVGQSVCKSGRTTHVTCGKIVALNQTVTYSSGEVVRGMIRAEIKCEHGDSGGALYAGSTGLGTLSGGDGQIEYFQPLPQSLRAYGARLD